MLNPTDRAQLAGFLEYARGLLQRFDYVQSQRAGAAAVLKPQVNPTYAPYKKIPQRWAWWVALLIGLGLGVVLAYLVGLIYLGRAPRAEWVTLTLLVLPVTIPVGFLLWYLRNKLMLEPQRKQAVTRNTEIERQNNARYEQWTQQEQHRAAENAPVLADIARFDGELEQIAIEYRDNVAPHFPPAYFYDDALVFCIGAVQNHRANSITEAINLYETELHRQRVEDIARAQLVEQQRAVRVAQMAAVVNAIGHASTASAVRAEGAANRTAAYQQSQAAQQAAARQADKTRQTIRDEADRIRRM